MCEVCIGLVEGGIVLEFRFSGLRLVSKQLVCRAIKSLLWQMSLRGSSKHSFGLNSVLVLNRPLSGQAHILAHFARIPILSLSCFQRCFVWGCEDSLVVAVLLNAVVPLLVCEGFVGF